MTFRESMIKAMICRGMFKSQAVEILNEYINSNMDSFMIDRWDDNVSGYPEETQFVLWIGVRHYAYRWLESNLPQAAYKPMFQYSEEELRKMIEDKKKVSNM